MKLAFIGGGNMAGALIGGLLQRERVPPQRIVVVEVSPERRTQLAREYGVIVRERPDEVVAHAPLVVLAVKPGDLRAACESLQAFGMRGLAVSIAAGVPTASIAKWLGSERVVRAMPNTPALVGQGITGLYARPAVDHAMRESATALLEAAGAAVWFDDEGMLDAVTAISGSGPGYVFRFIEALQQAAIEMGFPETRARQFAVQTFAGAAALAAQSAEPVSVLRERVTSPGGTTAAALAVMERERVGESIVAAAHAALARSRELGQAPGKG
jgi:pyrroline-5-carboxylate reductase